MKKLKLTGIAFDRGAVLNRTQMKQVMGGFGSGTPCVTDFDCGVSGHCIVGYCDNSFGSGTSCTDGHNGGCPIDRICVQRPDGIECI